MKNKYFFFIAALMEFCSCANVADNGSGSGATADGSFMEYDSLYAKASQYSDRVEIKYAKGLKVNYKDDGIHVLISRPDAPAVTEEIVIKEPKSRFICTTALQLGNFEILGMEKDIVGMNSLKNVFSPKMLTQLADGSTRRVGKEGNFDLEAVLAAKPDYIFVSASKYGGFESLKECGIPLIPHHGYKETHPLGQVEWIKLIGLLTGQTQRANAVFDEIEHQYLALKAKVSKRISAKKFPTVISGRQIRTGWYVVGGNSYMAQLFKDAGAKYIMDDNQESGGVTLDFEKVYTKALHADFWQTDGAYDGDFTLASLAAEDPRYTDVKAYKEGHVLFCNFSQTPYRELAGLEPHVMLCDFVKAFHPELLPDYTPKYYKIIK